MPTAWTQNYFHLVFATKGREHLLDDAIRPRVHAFLGGIARDLKCSALAINGWADHVHALIRFHPDVAQSQLVKNLKSRSTAWAKAELPGFGRFSWQEGYGGFTVSQSQVAKVQRYIERQEEHHRKQSFQDELDELLVKHGLERSPDGSFEYRD